MAPHKRIAIVGSGCSGIGALWALKSTEHEVHLYEASDRLGGHTNTVTFKHQGRTTCVDSGFIVMNSATYPNFIAFLKEIKIPTTPAPMTFGVSRDQGLFEWSGTSLSAVFAQRSNIFRPRVWQMLFDIIRFNQFALDLLSEADESEADPSSVNDAKHTASSYARQRTEQSIGDYLDQEGYSEAFRNDYLIPMTACVWSTSPDKCNLDFPALTLVRFLWNHHLLNSVAARPSWLTIKNGTYQYIDRVMTNFPKDKVHLNTPIKSLYVRKNGKVALYTDIGEVEDFDHVILATHGNQAMEIMRGVATNQEEAILSKFQTSRNTAVLHSDLSLMPARPIAWSSWNYITTSPKPNSTPQVCLTYWMNLLQNIPQETYGPVLLTLNSLHRPNPKLIQGSWTYHHPQYNTAAIRAQQQLPKIQNTRGISYAGAWTKYGFHEDGFSSGLKVAVEHLGAKLPFEFVDSTFSRGRSPVLGVQDHTLRVIIRLIQVFIALIGMVLRMMLGETETSQKKPNEKVY